MTAKVLLVGEDSSMMEGIRERVGGKSIDVQLVECSREALSIVEKTDIDVVVLNFKDLMAEGILFLRNLKKSSPLTEVITLNVPDAIRFSIESMKYGAFADLLMPFDPDVLVGKILEAWKKREKAKKGIKSFRQRLENLAASATFAEAGDFDTARKLAQKSRNSKDGSSKEDE